MLELRWATEPDGETREVVRFPHKHMALALHLGRYVTSLAEMGANYHDVILFRVQQGNAEGYYDIDSGAFHESG